MSRSRTPKCNRSLHANRDYENATKAEKINTPHRADYRPYNLIILSGRYAMKAIRIHSYGGPEVLQLEDIPRPSPGPGELLVKVHAASVNPVDWNVRLGHMQQFLPLKLPAVLGWDLSGVVEAVGPGA